MQLSMESAAPRSDKAARKRLKNQPNLKRNEQLVYDALQQSGRPLKAYGLLEMLQDHGLRAPMTIYRALDALIEKGLAKKIASLNAFTAVKTGEKKQLSAFFTCRNCGLTTEVPLRQEQISALMFPSGAPINELYVEAFGDCNIGNCTKAQELVK
ncbi:MAG: hypothetical protein AAFW68_02435 [Pseudomonadota bacterium]